MDSYFENLKDKLFLKFVGDLSDRFDEESIIKIDKPKQSGSKMESYTEWFVELVKKIKVLGFQVDDQSRQSYLIIPTSLMMWLYFVPEFRAHSHNEIKGAYVAGTFKSLPNVSIIVAPNVDNDTILFYSDTDFLPALFGDISVCSLKFKVV